MAAKDMLVHERERGERVAEVSPFSRSAQVVWLVEGMLDCSGSKRRLRFQAPEMEPSKVAECRQRAFVGVGFN